MNDTWLKAFRRDPHGAIADLFSGRAGVGSDLRLDIPELLYQQFPPSLADERVQLDDALGSWLSDMYEDYASQVERLGFSVYGKRVGDALIALQLLDLPRTKGRIRTNMGAWQRWLSPLRLASERDPGLECFRLLTRGQPDTRHTALWLRIATDPRPEYLTVALAGLRLLPNQGNARKNQVLMLQALLRHTAKIHHEVGRAKTFFNHHFAALRSLFPRDPQYWEQVLDEALDGFRKHTVEPIAEELVRSLQSDARAKLRATHHNPSSGKVQKPTPATREEWDTLKKDILDSVHRSEMLAQRLFGILERNHNYAEATGVSHFFVRTLHNVGPTLLEQRKLGPADMARFGVMIERALAWEPANPHCWMLWAEWFKAQGHRDAQEATLREMLRLFPNDLLPHVELAHLLITRGEACWDEAEHHLRNAMDRHPNEGHPRVVMTRLLALRERFSEAEALLTEFLGRIPHHTIAQASLNWLRAGTYLDNTAPAFDDECESGIQVRDGHDDPPMPFPGALRELLRRGSLAREFSRAVIAAGQGIAAPTDRIRQESLKGDPLAGFYSQWLMPAETPKGPPHAWAWRACRCWQEAACPDQWQALARQFPEAAPETEFLRLLAALDDGNGSDPIDWHVSSGNNGASRAVDALIRETREKLVVVGPSGRDELARMVMACAAMDPGIVWASAA